MNRIKKGVWLLSILTVLASCGSALGATFYVNGAGDGAGTGSIDHPFTTIQDGIDAAAYGDTVRVAPGIYHEFIRIKNGVRLIGGNGLPTIDGGVSASGVGSRTLFDGFRMTNNVMFVTDSNLRIRVCIFENNTGGLVLERSSPHITDCWFENNETWFFGGGGIFMTENSNPTIERCYFENNVAVGDAGTKGGAIEIAGFCHPTIKDCEFRGNRCTNGGGGGISIQDSTVLIENCVFKENRTEVDGGAITASELFAETLVIIYNSTFYENEACGGGAIANSGAAIVLANCSFYDNRATDWYDPQGSALFNSERGSIGAFNSIIWNNAYPQISTDGDSPLVVQYCDVEGGFEGEGNIDADPEFVNAGRGNFHLRSDSPCIDAGFDFFLMPETDVDGGERIVDGNGDGIAVPDMGIDEYLGTRPLRIRGTITLLD